MNKKDITALLASIQAKIIDDDKFSDSEFRLISKLHQQLLQDDRSNVYKANNSLVRVEESKTGRKHFYRVKKAKIDSMVNIMERVINFTPKDMVSSCDAKHNDFFNLVRWLTENGLASKVDKGVYKAEPNIKGEVEKLWDKLPNKG